ncbi:unnamed protein product [Rhizophagus irregularis]|nr:unnamed protein product [Rhizophagus irregularis]
MDPSIYQQQPQQPQQPSRAPYPFSGNPQGSSTVMGAGAYSEQATAKRALGSGAQVQPMFSNMGQTSNQNQLYTTGFPNQIVGRSTVPTQSFVNTDNQNIDAIHNSIQQEESQVDWLDLGDDEEVVYDFNCSTEFNDNNSKNGNQHHNHLSQQQHSQPPSIHITQPSQQQLQREDASYAYSSIPSLPSSNVSQICLQKVYRIVLWECCLVHLIRHLILVDNQSVYVSQNQVFRMQFVDHYNQSPQSTVESKSNSLINLRTATQEHQGESTSILPSNDNQNSFNANVQVTSANSRITPSTDIPKDINNIPFNTEMLGSALHSMNNSNNGNNNRIQDLGAVDVHALTMSLKCGMKLEVINALNTLTTLSYYRSAQIDLKQCGDLVDVLFDMILEYVDHVSPVNEKNNGRNYITTKI